MKDPDVRRSAIFALGKIGSEKAIEHLKSALGDKSGGALDGVKDAVYNSLERISRTTKEKIAL
jgi:HEAT repeat protein